MNTKKSDFMRWLPLLDNTYIPAEYRFSVGPFFIEILGVVGVWSSKPLLE